jgi:hypothetical protein
MSAPTTLGELRAAVARVLVARGEAHDNLDVALYPATHGRVAVYICGCFTLAMVMIAPTEAEAIDRAWRTVLQRMEDGEASAVREVVRAATRVRAAEDGVTEARRDLDRARAALAAAREAGS